jgi:hypothetical protein
MDAHRETKIGIETAGDKTTQAELGSKVVDKPTGATEHEIRED